MGPEAAQIKDNVEIHSHRPVLSLKFRLYGINGNNINIAYFHNIKFKQVILFHNA